MASKPPLEQAAAAAGSSAPSFEYLDIKNRSINEADGIKLSDHQKLVVGSVLDLFGGNPTLRHFTLWSPTATFQDPLTVARGFDQYAAQWYGLPALFHPIRIQSHRVTGAGNPLVLELRNKYTVKGIRSDQVIESQVHIWLGEDGKIEKLEDRWDGKLHDGPVAEVRDDESETASSSAAMLSLPWTAARWGLWQVRSWTWWTFVVVSGTWPFMVFKKLNANTVPKVVKVPANEEEDMAMKRERESRS